MRDMPDEVPNPVSPRELRWRRVVGFAGGIILLVCAYRALAHPADGDFKLHWEFGRRFLAGEFLYAGGMHLPYPPFWAMAHALAALLPLAVAKAFLFPLGVAALFALLWVLRALAGDAWGLHRPRAFWAATFALVLVGRYVIRDFAELGVNTTLVALSWLAIYFWTQRRELVGGAVLGLAVALKCTPAIVVGYFLWKRQWKMFAVSGAATALFTLAPMIWQGPGQYAAHLEFWAGNVWRGVGNNNPAVGVLGPEPVQNMALRPTLARYLMRLPADHPGRSAHVLDRNLLALSPVVAGWVIKTILLTVGAGFLWWSRAAVVRRDAPRILWELAALGILMLLFSPITWGQHAVALLPAAFFIGARFVTGSRFPRWMLAVLALFLIFVPLLSRDLIGREAALLLASYHVETFAMIGLLAVVVGCARLQRS